MKARRRRDLFIVAGVGVFTYAVSARLDLFEGLIAFAERHEVGEVDEIIVALLAVGVTIGILLLLRWRELLIERADHAMAKGRLEASEAQFRQVFASARDSVFIKDRDFRYVQVNGEMERLLGRPAAHLIGLTDAEIFGGAAYQRACVVERRVLAGEFSDETLTNTIRGIRQTFHVIKVPVRDEDGTICGICGIARDITATHTANERLKEHDGLLHSIIEGTDDAVFVKDLDERYVLTNSANAAIIGRPLEAIIGRTEVELFGRQEAEQVRQIDFQVLKSGKHVVYEDRRTLPSGESRIFSVAKYPRRAPDGSINGIVGVARDITEHKRVAQELIEKEERMGLALQAADIGTWDWHVPDGSLEIDERMAAMGGWELAEAPRNFDAWMAVIAPEDRANQLARLNAAVEGETDFFEHEIRLVSPTGQVRWGLSRGKVVERDAEGRGVRLIGTTLDITNQHRAMDAIGFRDRVLGALFGVADTLLSTRDLGGALEAALRILGRATHTHVVQLFELSVGAWDDDVAHQRCLWTSGETLPTGMPLSEHLAFDAAGLGRWRDMLANGRVVLGNAAEFPAEERAVLDTCGIRALVVVPVTVSGRDWGFICFADCRAERDWNPVEVDALRSAASVIGAAISSDMAQEELRQTERDLRRSEGLLRAILNATPDWIFIKDRQYRYLFANGGYARAMGLVPEDLIGKTDEEVGFSNELILGDLAKGIRGFRTDDKAALSGNTVHNPYDPATFADGSLHVFDTHKIPLRDEQGAVFGALGFSRDITERLETERELQELERIVNTSPTIAFVWRAEKGWPVEFVSDNVRQFGFTPADFRRGGLKFADIIHAEDLDRVEREIAQFSAERRTQFQQEYRIITRDGGVRWVDDRTWLRQDEGGEPTHYHGIVVDITDRKQAEDDVRKFKTISDLADYGVAILDREYRLIYANGVLADMHGWTPSELIGQSVLTLYPESWHKEIIEILDRLERGELINARELEDLRRDETVFPTMANATRIRNEQRQTVFYSMTVVDITDLKKAEAERRQLEEMLRHSQKMDAIGTLAAGVAHDFNNLVTAITGYAENALVCLERGEDAARAVEGISNAAQQAGDITKSLLAFSRKSDTAHAPLRLADVLEQSIRMARHVLPASVAIVTDLPGGESPWVIGEATQLQRILLNLYVNARDAMPEGGLLRVCLQPGRLTRGEHGGAQETPAEGVSILVEDTGMGMSPEVLSRIFEPFYTTKPRGKGSGLGMSTVHGLVQEHKGEIHVDSTEGEGTRVTLTLPRCEPQAEEAPVAGEGRRVVRGHGEIVLLAEDNRQVRAIMAAHLSEAGYHVIQAADGEEALHVFELHRANTRLLVLDLDMPKRDGLSCLRYIRRQRPEIPAVVISGLPRIEEESDAWEDVTFLRKPFQMCELVQLVRHRMVS